MNPTIARITARGLLGRRRIWLLVPLPVMLIGFAWAARAFGEPPASWGEPVIVGLGFTAVLPVIALIVGTGVLGSEIDDGTITHILSKPLPR
jgi:ABC-2 type transport system permease protein